MNFKMVTASEGLPVKPAPVETQGSKSTLEVRTGQDSGRDWTLRRNFLPVALLGVQGPQPTSRSPFSVGETRL